MRVFSPGTLAETTVVLRHALRNGLTPVVTLIGLQAPLLIGGAVILKQIFVVRGMGLLLLEAVFSRDYPVVSGVFLIVGVGILFINFLVDLTYWRAFLHLNGLRLRSCHSTQGRLCS